MANTAGAGGLSSTLRGGIRPQFMAVILADVDAHALYPLTNDLPKSLLPLLNRPLLQYQLDLLHASGFSECVVVTTRDAHDRVQILVRNEYRGDVAVDLVCVENHFGTADMLRAIKDKIKTDFLVLTGDLVLGRHLHDVIDLHRAKRSDLTFLLKRLPPPSPAVGGKRGEGGGGGGGGGKGGKKGGVTGGASIVGAAAAI
ncbi:hypothetical protein VYU27_002574, partial [Nannochloropsis oceanica]